MVYVVQLRDSGDKFSHITDIYFDSKEEADEFAENVYQATKAKVSAVVQSEPVFDRSMGETWLKSFLKNSGV